jgi:hypothetical protein
MVKVLPEPVTPSRVWNTSPSSMPSTSWRWPGLVARGRIGLEQLERRARKTDKLALGEGFCVDHLE